MNPAKHPFIPDYRGMQLAPDKESGAPLSDLTGGEHVYPGDVYSHPSNYYMGEPQEERVFSTVLTYRGFPNRPVMVYRAVAASEEAGIEAGDWVTISRAHAITRGQEELGRETPQKILSKTVFARDIFTSGDSILDWGYDPQPFDRRVNGANRERQAVRRREGMDAIERALPAPLPSAQMKVVERSVQMLGRDCTHWQIAEGLSIIGFPVPGRGVVVVDFIYSRHVGTQKVEEGLRYLHGRFGALAPGITMPKGEAFWREMESHGLPIDWQTAALVTRKPTAPLDVAAVYLPTREPQQKRPLAP